MKERITYSGHDWEKKMEETQGLICQFCGEEGISGGTVELLGTQKGYQEVAFKCPTCNAALAEALFAAPFHFGDLPYSVCY
ncbi:MAG: hypothetical protein ACXABY_06150 [Candidatus Thorarchaeota archaeon]|jgi:hypothetical protein